MCEKCEANGIFHVNLKMEVGLIIESELGSQYFETNKDIKVLKQVEERALEISKTLTSQPVFVYVVETLSEEATGRIYRRNQEAHIIITNGETVIFAGIEKGKEINTPPDFSEN